MRVSNEETDEGAGRKGGGKGEEIFAKLLLHLDNKRVGEGGRG